MAESSRMCDELEQPIEQSAIEQFARDGVVVLRNVIPKSWVERMAPALALLADDIRPVRGHAAEPGSFIADTVIWQVINDFRDFAWYSPAARIAAALMRSKRINFYHDQLFIKPPHCVVRTPWHHDITFWPLEGEQICTIWLPTDTVEVASGGVEFVAGSHLWGKRFKAVRPDNLSYMLSTEFEDPPDIDSDRSHYNIVSWTLNPGDVLVFDARTLHGASGNLKGDPRRAFATRWVGDDVRYMPRAATVRFPWKHDVRPGEPLSGPLFPQILPEPIAQERYQRSRGPVHKNPELVREIRNDYQAAEAQLRSQ